MIRVSPHGTLTAPDFGKLKLTKTLKIKDLAVGMGDLRMKPLALLQDHKIHNMSFFYYCVSIVLVALVLSTSFLFARINFVLKLGSFLFYSVATLPVVLSKGNFIHPMMIQMPFFFVQAMSVIIKSIGCLPLGFNKFYDPFQKIYLENSCAKVLLINSIGLLVTYIFCYLKVSCNRPFSFELKRTRTVLILFVLSVVAFFLLISQLGSLVYIMSNMQKRLTSFSPNSNMYCLYISQWGTYVGLYCYIVGKKKISLSILAFQVFVNVILADRGNIIVYTVFPLLVAHHLVYSRIRVFRLLIVMLLLLTIYQVGGNMRSYGTIVGESTQKNFILDIFDKVEHLGITTNLIGLIDSGEIEHTYGKPLLGIIYAPFPRSIFPSKPKFIAESALVGSLIYNVDYFSIGLPPGLYGYGYLNFGWIGVFVFAMVSGICVNIFYNSLVGFYYKKKERVPSGNVLVYCSLMSLVVNPLSTEVQIKVLIIVFPLLFFYLFARMRRNNSLKHISSIM